MDLFSDRGLIKVSEVTVPDSLLNRISTWVPPLDEALGGGFVRGSVILFGGEPGVGKTTLLLQLLSRMSQNSIRCVYDSAEESIHQLKVAYQRLKEPGDFWLGNLSGVEDLVEAVVGYRADLVVVDSIQGLRTRQSEARPGTPTQLTLSCNSLIRFAKESSVALAIICQLSKDGGFRGPKDLEHNVDVVGTLSHGKDPHRFRVLVFTKNRFGPTMMAKHLPWVSQEGRYHLDPDAIQPVEAPPVVGVESPRRQESSPGRGQRISGGVTSISHREILHLAAHEFQRLGNPNPHLLLSILGEARNRYGPFRIQESDGPLFGIRSPQFEKILRWLADDYRFQVESQNPLSLWIP